MDGILAINPIEQASRMQNVPVRSKGLGNTSARKPLARIENTSQKSVTFDRGALKSTKLGKNLQSSSIKSNTPAPRSIKVSKSSASKKKVASTAGFKIFTDNTEEKDEHEIEYMPPGDKEEPELPMPAYLYKACAGKPTFNINIPRYGLCDEKLHEYEDAIVKDIERESERILRETKFEEQDLDAIIESISCATFVSDEDILEQLENDQSFSLKQLDREIRTAGLVPPDW